MKRIFKYPLLPEDIQQLRLPKGAILLTIQSQYEVPTAWALVDDEEPGQATRIIRIYGTGEALPENPGVYISTYQLKGGSLVFHVFDATKTEW